MGDDGVVQGRSKAVASRVGIPQLAIAQDRQHLLSLVRIVHHNHGVGGVDAKIGKSANSIFSWVILKIEHLRDRRVGWLMSNKINIFMKKGGKQKREKKEKNFRRKFIDKAFKFDFFPKYYKLRLLRFLFQYNIFNIFGLKNRI